MKRWRKMKRIKKIKNKNTIGNHWRKKKRYEEARIYLMAKLHVV